MSQRGAGYSIHGNIQGQAGQDPEQPDPVEIVPAHCNTLGFGLMTFKKSLTTQTILWFSLFSRNTVSGLLSYLSVVIFPQSLFYVEEYW